MVAPRRRKMAAPPQAKSVTLPAPTGGLNTIAAGSAIPPTDCIQAFNLMLAEYGLRARLGWREWCTGLTGDADDQVRSVLPFTGSATTSNRLFATTATGIWDVTASTDTPTPVLAFAITTGDAGYGVSHVVVTAAGHFFLYADEVNGLHVYMESTDTWAAVAMGAGAGEISGVNPVDVVHVNVFKNRVWLTERNTARAYYLAAGAIYGAATAFEFGTKFRAGGSLIGLWNWTIDAGIGIDDHLVAISSGGDVAVYDGTDPASATTFGLRGVWSIGAPPAGRQIAGNMGGDLQLITPTGLLPMSKLLSGEAEDPGSYTTEKIANLFNAAMLSRATYKRWALRMNPEDNSLMVMIPEADGAATTQLARSNANKSWYRYRDLPIYSSEVWGRKLYFGTADGKVCVNDGYVDGVTLAEPDAYTPIQWALLTSFQSLGSGRQKQIQMIRPTILSESANPAFAVEARYRYDFAEVGAVNPGTAPEGTWDASTWDVTQWGGDYTAQQAVRGAVGLGPDMAIAIRGTALARTILVSFDVVFTEGGFL